MDCRIGRMSHQAASNFSNPAADFKGLMSARLNRSGPEKIPRRRADLPGGDFAQSLLDFVWVDDFAVTEPLFADPHHLVLAVFQAQIELADEIIARAAQFRRRHQLRGQSLHFAQDEFERFFQIIQVQARRDDDVARVVEKTVGAVNGIGQAVLFAHALEKARTHVFAQDGIEQAQGVTPFVMARTGADAQGDLRLLGLFGAEAQGGLGLRGTAGA